MTREQKENYAKRKHIFINVFTSFAIITGTVLIFLGVIHPTVNVGEILTGALSLIVPAMAILGVENHVITKFLFKEKEADND